MKRDPGVPSYVPDDAVYEFYTWRNMKSRCNNPNNKRWDRYGGRGVSVCARWKGSFLTFLADMGRRPSKEHTIDRKDNDGNYTPTNCRWVTRDVQNANRCYWGEIPVLGVNLHKKTGLYQWSVQRRGVRRLGYKPTIEEAVEAREAAIRELEAAYK